MNLGSPTREILPASSIRIYFNESIAHTVLPPEVQQLRVAIQEKIAEIAQKIQTARFLKTAEHAVMFEHPNVTPRFQIDHDGLSLETEEKTRSAIWLDTAIKGGLLIRLARRVKQRLKNEDYDDILGETGICAAKWARRGTFDEILESGKPPHESNLAEWVFRKVVDTMKSRGTDPQWRERYGARSSVELRDQRPRDFKAAPETVGHHREVDAEGVATVIPHDLKASPEAAFFEHTERNDQLGFLQEILEAKHQREPVRRVRVMAAIIRGSNRDEIGDEIQASPLRVAHLSREIRSDLREGARILTQARRILAAVLEEPWSTKEELSTDLAIDPEDVDTALKILVNRRLARTTPNGSIGPTRAAFNEMF